jgi:hypothetical protein
MPAGDIFVTNAANTPFSVIASKGAVSGSSSSSSGSDASDCNAAVGEQVQHETYHALEQQEQAQQQQQQQQAGQQQQQQQQLWKVFSQEPLSEELLQQLFINGSAIISKPWKAYPQ